MYRLAVCRFLWRRWVATALEALAGRLAADDPSAAESLRERGLSTTNAIENVNNGSNGISAVSSWPRK